MINYVFFCIHSSQLQGVILFLLIFKVFLENLMMVLLLPQFLNYFSFLPLLFFSFILLLQLGFFILSSLNFFFKLVLLFLLFVLQVFFIFLDLNQVFIIFFELILTNIFHFFIVTLIFPFIHFMDHLNSYLLINSLLNSSNYFLLRMLNYLGFIFNSYFLLHVLNSKFILSSVYSFYINYHNY